MDTGSILNKLICLLKKLCYKEEVNYEEISFDTRLKEDLGLDSIQIIMMAIGIEKEFDVIIQNVDFSSFATAGDVVNYIKDYQNEDF